MSITEFRGGDGSRMDVVQNIHLSGILKDEPRDQERSQLKSSIIIWRIEYQKGRITSA